VQALTGARGMSVAGLWTQMRGHAMTDGHGTDGNERLTALTAAALFVLLAVEGVTIVSLSTLLTPHIFIGVVLIPPVLLKLGSTGYRFVRYYTGDREYRAVGPPAMPLRLLAPFLVLLTVIVFASGVALVLAGSPHGSTLFTVHKASFILWFIVAAMHILYYVVRVPRIVGAESGRPPRAHGAVNRGLRFTVLAGALVVGVGLGIAFLPSAHSWEATNPPGLGDGRAHVVRDARALQRPPGAPVAG
jgi:hypothetical protein